MTKISEIVRDLIEKDDEALQAMQYGIMNFSSYARIIQPHIEKKLLKKVDIKSIVIALSRLSQAYEGGMQKNTIKIRNLSIYSDLIELTIEKTQDNLQAIQQIHTLAIEQNKEFFVTVESLATIGVIATNDIIDATKKILHGKPIKSEIADLTGISLIINIPSSNRPIAFTPNSTYEILKRLAVKNINLVEIVSTTDELTLIVEKQNTEKVLSQLQVYL